jgi:hypothetical protein
MPVIPYVELEPTLEEDEAWSMFLLKYENIKLPPTPYTRNDIEEMYQDGLFGKSIRSL